MNASVPLASPRARTVHGPIAKLTMANEKIVFAKSYSAQDSPSTGLPDRVIAPRPRHQVAGARAVTTGRAAASAPIIAGACSGKVG